jgi:S1-C subfamily serine protease
VITSGFALFVLCLERRKADALALIPTMEHQAIVTIHAIHTVKSGYFLNNIVKTKCTGSVFDGEFVVTSIRDVEDCKSISVRLSDGRRVVGTFCGSDSDTGLALIKIDAAVPKMAIAKPKVSVGPHTLGSPVLNDRQEVVGVVTILGGVYHVVPVDEVRSAIDKIVRSDCN